MVCSMHEEDEDCGYYSLELKPMGSESQASK